jgi:hypothetical protein
MPSCDGVRRDGLWLCLVSVGCATATPQAEPPCFSCDDQRVVRVVPLATLRSNDPERRLQHPVNLSQAEWETRPAGCDGAQYAQPVAGAVVPRRATEPVFLDTEVRALGSSLRQAFEQATEQEAVVFATARATDEGPAQVTSGAWFVEGRPNPSPVGQLSDRREHAIDTKADLDRSALCAGWNIL